MGVHPGHRGIAHSPLGHVQHTLGRYLVDRVGGQPQVSHGITDLATVVEAPATHHLVRHPHGDQLFLHGPALGVGPVEDRHVGPRATPVVHAAELAHRPAGLVVLVVGPEPDDGVAAAGVGPQLLWHAAEVLRDDSVGGVQNRLGRPVVLVQNDDRGIRERPLEFEDVAYVGAPEPVNRLVAVTHHADVAMPGSQQHDQLVLHNVGVLVLVDQHVLETLLVFLEYVGIVFLVAK